MGTDPEAHIYFGFTQERDEWGEFKAHSLIQRDADGDEDAHAALVDIVDSIDPDEEATPSADEDPWDGLHANIRWENESGLRVGLIGYDENLGFYICAKASFKRAEWAEVVDLEPSHFQVDPAWIDQLKATVKEYGLNVHEAEPGWHLSALWF